MSDLSISQKFNMPITTPQFRSSNTNPISSTSKENKGLSTGAKVAIGTGLVALASYGIYVATRGKVKPKTTPPLTTNNPVQEIKELAVSAFKEAGNKFVKGKAVMADGTNYTGKIVSEGKDGSKVVMEYLDGVLQKSTKTKGTDTVIKTYKYSDELGLAQVRKQEPNAEGIICAGKDNMVFRKSYDEALKQTSINDGKLIIDHETGIIMKNNGFIDKETGLRGYFAQRNLIVSENGLPNYSIRIKGKEVPETYVMKQATNFSSNEALVVEKISSIYDNVGNPGIDIRTDYIFDNTGKYTKSYKITGGYGQYNELIYDYKNGIVKNGEDALFKYNPRTKEVTELTIDKDLAQQIVEYGEKHFEFLKRATKTYYKGY